MEQDMEQEEMVTCTIKLSAQEAAWLKAFAKKEFRSVEDEIRYILARYRKALITRKEYLTFSSLDIPDTSKEPRSPRSISDDYRPGTD